MSEQETYNLDRQIAIDNNVDALGKKWEIVQAGRESNLVMAIPNPYREDFVCPKPFIGKWTSRDLLQDQITLYLKQSWDQAESIRQKNARKKAAAEEAATEAKKLEKQAAKLLTRLNGSEVLPEDIKTLPTEEKEALIQTAVDAENAEIASKSEAKRIVIQKGK